MHDARASARRALRVYVVVCVAVFAVTRLEGFPVIGGYVHLAVASIFLLTAIAMTRHDPRRYGVALGGLLEPSRDERPAGPLGVLDLGRAVVSAAPSAAVELVTAALVALVVFPLYTVGYWWWTAPTHGFALSLPPSLFNVLLTQLIVVALPEEAFFRGYLQTSLSEPQQPRTRVLGVWLAPRAWALQAILFAAIHFIVEPHPSRLAVFFPGLLFGWVRAWRGGVGAATALHAMSNLYSEILARSWL